jgi:Zn-dependent protease
VPFIREGNSPGARDTLDAIVGIGHRFKILTVRGIPLYVATSFLFIAALFVFGGYSQLESVAGPTTALLLATLEFVLLFGSVLIHEVSHAVVARGFDVPVSGITLTFWGGATETRADSRGPLAEFLISAAGPFSTLILAGLFLVTANTMDPGRLQRLVEYLAEANVFLTLLNLVPGYPLDGGRMLEAAAWGFSRRRRTGLQVAGWASTAVGLGMIGFAIVSFGDDGLSGWTIWLAIIGFILFGTGRAMPQRIATRDQLAGVHVRDVMRLPDPAIDASLSLAEALDAVLRDSPDRAFPVVAEGRVIGTVSLTSARRVGARDPMRPVRDAVRPLNQTITFAPDDALEDAVEWLQGRDAMVLRDGVLVGYLGPPDVELWFRRRADPSFVATPPRPDM